MGKITQQHLKQIKNMIDTGQYRKAEKLCLKILKIDPEQPVANLNLAVSYYFKQRYADAAVLFKKVLAQYPDHSEARSFLFGCYKEDNQFDAMLELATQFRDNPLNPVETLSAFRAFQDTCNWTEAGKLTATVIEDLKQGLIPLSYIRGILLSLNTIAEVSADDLYEIHRYWGDKTIAACSRLRATHPQAPQGKIKLAYLSADFNKHPVGHLSLPVLQNHDKDKFEIFCYAVLLKDDDMTDEFRQTADHFVDITGLSHAEAAQRIARDGIHILVDLSGHTANAPLDILAYQPAPVQITYLGYPNTTGLTTVDFRITDQYSDIEGGTRYTEQLLKMPETFLCMRGLPNVPRSEKTPSETEGFVTFGSFNHIRKANPQVIEAWARTLQAVEGSRMLIKSAGCHLDVIKNNILQEFSRHGIDAGRITFATYMNSYEEHAALYNQVDIALDTFPYHGTHTTCEALWMGVPVITLEGKCHAQRVSSSVLKCIGFESTIARTMDEYIEKAVDLGSRPENLSFLRKCIHTLFKHSMIFNPEEVTRQLEAQYIRAWEIKMGYPPALAQQGAATEKQIAATAPVSDARLTLASMIAEASGVKGTIIAEVGARMITDPSRGEAAEIFHSLEHAEVIAFEADADACNQINSMTDQFTANVRAYPYALGREKARQTLYITQDGMCSSLYKPNETVMRRFEALDVAYLKEEVPIDVISLDEFIQIEQVTDIDFIKIDVQGAELDVFKGGEHALQHVIGICTEVEWAELYEGQPLFADVDQYLRGHGFQLHHFIGTGSRPLKGAVLPGVHQQLWTDAVYFPSFERIETLTSDKLVKLAVMATLYDAYDLAHHALKRYDKVSSKRLASTFYHCFHPEQQITSTAKEKATTVEKQATLPIPIEGDIRIVVPNDLNLMTPYILTEQQDWFEDEIKFIRKLIKPGTKALDIGANYGCYAMTLAKLIGDSGRLWAFEPASSTAGFLSETISCNGITNTTLIKAALSNRTGTAELSLEGNSELNSIAEQGSSGLTESVPLMRLDDCMKSYQWRDIAFIKLDAEGEEIHILEGGQTFFSQCSPLVMFELKHGDQVNEGLIQKFESMGYQSYVLIPGLQILAPFNHSEAHDGYLLNLFCCKQDTAQALANNGLLVLETGHDVDLPTADWLQTLSRHAYANELMTLWQSRATTEPLPGRDIYELALNHYASAHTEACLDSSLPHLQQSFIHLVSLLDVQVTIPRLMTLVRVATELGHRSVAVQVLNQITQHFEQETTFYPTEPFLAVSQIAEDTDTDKRLADWCLASVLAAKEKLQAFSSYFTGQAALPGIERFLQLGYPDDDMLRRSKLIRQRFNL